jgi:hypothetical protein
MPTDLIDQELELPALEAVLAGTLALMTGYGQALQADLHPGHRLAMGAKVARNLGMLADDPRFSDNFRTVLARLGGRWQWMTCCTHAAQADAAAGLPH